MGSHVDSKIASCCARVVALRTNKGLLSAVNSLVSFQRGRRITRIAALLAIVIFICMRRKVDDFKLAGHVVIFLLFGRCGR